MEVIWRVHELGVGGEVVVDGRIISSIGRIIAIVKTDIILHLCVICRTASRSYARAAIPIYRIVMNTRVVCGCSCCYNDNSSVSGITARAKTIVVNEIIIYLIAVSSRSNQQPLPVIIMDAVVADDVIVSSTHRVIAMDPIAGAVIDFIILNNIIYTRQVHAIGIKLLPGLRPKSDVVYFIAPD